LRGPPIVAAMPNAAAQKAYIGRLFDRAAASYDRVGNALFPPAGAALVAAVALCPDDRVLDVGCGRGACLFPAAEAVGPTGSITGIDLAAAMVEATAVDITRRGVANASVRVGDAESPEFPDHSFDAVLAGFVVFFLPDLAVALRSYARLLRPGGRLALSTFAEPSDQEIAFARTCGAAVAPYLPPPSTSDNPPPLQRLRTPESVTGAVQAAGFVDVRSEQRDFDSPAQSWHWLWSGGLRGLVEQVPEDQRDDARAAFIHAVDQLSGPADSVAMTGSVRFTTARLPS
jgi:ubiquinone/menaquinone biosynthesis C-methylase UbiE